MSLESVEYDLLVGLLFCGVAILGFMSMQLWDIKACVAVLVAEFESQKKEIEDHEQRLRTLERKKSGFKQA